MYFGSYNLNSFQDKNMIEMKLSIETYPKSFFKIFIFIFYRNLRDSFKLVPVKIISKKAAKESFDNWLIFIVIPIKVMRRLSVKFSRNACVSHPPKYFKSVKQQHKNRLRP